MSDTAGLSNADDRGVPAQEQPERFEREPAQKQEAPVDTGREGTDTGSEPPPADFDPAERPSNPDLVEGEPGEEGEAPD